jgi:hypothetical protein
MRLVVYDEMLEGKKKYVLEITHDELIQVTLSPRLMTLLKQIDNSNCPLYVRMLGLAALTKEIEEIYKKSKPTDYDNETPIGQQYLDGFDEED